MSAPLTDHFYTAAAGFMPSRAEGVLGTISGEDLHGDNQMILAYLTRDNRGGRAKDCPDFAMVVW